MTHGMIEVDRSASPTAPQRRGRHGRRALVAAAAGLIVVLAGTVTPAMAASVTRYASPMGSSTDSTCAQASPCTLEHATNISVAGDTVMVDGSHGERLSENAE